MINTPRNHKQLIGPDVTKARPIAAVQPLELTQDERQALRVSRLAEQPSVDDLVRQFGVPKVLLK